MLERRMPDDARTWEANLLGEASVAGPFGRVERLRTRTAFVLLVFLIVNRGRAHAREELVERFWPDDEIEAGRGKLRLALHSIRAALGDLLDADRHAVRIASPDRVSSDRDEMLRLAAAPEGPGRAACLSRAAALYRGPFLPGFYDDWVLKERDRLETLAARLLKEIAADHARSERWPEALEVAHRALVLDPYDEPTHRTVLCALQALGRREALVRAIEWTRERFAEVGRDPLSTVGPFCPSETVETEESEPALLGREADLARTLREIDRSPVVTLWGPPGVGKTRLARAAVRAIDRGTAFVSAVGVGSVEALIGVLRPALGDGSDSPREIEGLAESASSRLIVLDNLESLPDNAVALFARLRARNPRLRFLFTSQRPTGLAEETIIALAPLDAPPEGASPAQAAASLSVRLLAERARERGRRLRVDETNAAALGALCRRLEGVPLALELAAEWLDILGPADVLRRLDESGRRLDARLPGRDPRHRSLETAIAESLGRLDERQRAGMRALAVFLGGWDLAAAESVLDDDAAGLLAELESRALVKVEMAGGRVRYGMLESIRLLLRDAMPENARRDALRRHADHFARVGAAMQADPTSLVAEHRADDENVRQAAETILATEPDPERAACEIGGFQGYWQKLGRWELAERSLGQALDRLPKRPSRIRGQLGIWRAYVGYATENPDLSEAGANEAHAAFLAVGDRSRAGQAAGSVGFTRAWRGDFEGAIPLYREYLDASEGLSDAGQNAAYARILMGEAHLACGREEGILLLEEGLARGIECGATARAALACDILGWHQRLLGHPALGLPYLRRSVALYEGTAEPFRILTAHAHLATTLADLGEGGAANAALGRALEIAVALGRAGGYADASEAGAWAANDPKTAARLLGASRRWRRRARALAPAHVERIVGFEASLKETLGEAAYREALLEGETASRGEIVATIRAVAEGRA